jgi:hypothetical protein
MKTLLAVVLGQNPLRQTLTQRCFRATPGRPPDPS